MTMLTSLIHYLRKHRARRRQVRNALLMLTVSGVVRASHVEPRYFARPTRVDVVYRLAERPVAIASAKSSHTSLWEPQIKIDLSRVRHWISAIRPARLQVGQ